ncbi:Mu transposase domain-containing protein [Magnetospira thiophila]
MSKITSRNCCPGIIRPACKRDTAYLSPDNEKYSFSCRALASACSGVDYHVEVAKNFYSVPHSLIKQTFWARITERSVEIFHKGTSVATHACSVP